MRSCSTFEMRRPPSWRKRAPAPVAELHESFGDFPGEGCCIEIEKNLMIEMTAGKTAMILLSCNGSAISRSLQRRAAEVHWFYKELHSHGAP